MLNERALESAAKTLDPEMWSDDAENYLDAFERKPHDKSRYLDFVTKHGDFAVARRRKIAREKATAAVTAYLSSLSDETDRQRRGMEEVLREQGERDIPFAPADTMRRARRPCGVLQLRSGAPSSNKEQQHDAG